MNKSHLHHLWTRFRKVKPWYFLIAFVITTGLSVDALRQNNLTMARLRTDVYQVDKSNGNVEAALKNLQAYVVGNMNTDLSSGPNAPYPPIQLEYTYQRLETAEQQRVSSVNSTVYTQAQAYCQQQNPISFSGRTRVPCVEQYVNTHGTTAQTIPANLYEFDFLSPLWSPDTAGWLVLASFALLLLFMLSWSINRWFKHQLA